MEFSFEVAWGEIWVKHLRPVLSKLNINNEEKEHVHEATCACHREIENNCEDCDICPNANAVHDANSEEINAKDKMYKDRFILISSSTCQTDNDKRKSVLFRIVFDGKVDEVLLCEMNRSEDKTTDEESLDKLKWETHNIEREREHELNNKSSQLPIQNQKILYEEHLPSQNEENSPYEKNFYTCNNGYCKINDIWSESNNMEFLNNTKNIDCSDNKAQKHRFLYKIRATSTEDLICSLRRRECVCALVLTSASTEEYVNNSEHALHEKLNEDTNGGLKLTGNHIRRKCANNNIKQKEIVIASANITLLNLFNSRATSFIFFIDRKALSIMSKQCHKWLWESEEEYNEEENQELTELRKISYLQEHVEQEEWQEQQLVSLHLKNDNHTKLQPLEQTHLYNSSSNIEQVSQCSISSNKGEKIECHKLMGNSDQWTSIKLLQKLNLQPCSSVRLTLCMREVKEVKMQLCNLSLRNFTHHNKTKEDVNENCKFVSDIVAGRYELSYALVKEKNTKHREKLWNMQTRENFRSWKNERSVNSAAELISGKKVKLCSVEPILVDVNTSGEICKSDCNVCSGDNEDATTMSNSFPVLTFKMTTTMLQQCHLAITLKSINNCNMHSCINNGTKNSDHSEDDNSDDDDNGKLTETKKSSKINNKELFFKLPIRTAEALALQSEEDERNDRCTLPFTVLESKSDEEYISHHELHKKELVQKVISRNVNKENESVCTYQIEGELVLFHLPQLHEVARRFSQITLEEKELPETVESNEYELESDTHHCEDANNTATDAADADADVTFVNDTNIDVEVARRYVEKCNDDNTIKNITDSNYISGKDGHDAVDENNTDEQENNVDSNNHTVSDAANHIELYEQDKSFVEYNGDQGDSRRSSDVLELKNDEEAGQCETLHHDQLKESNEQECTELPIAKTEESICFPAAEQNEDHHCNLDDVISVKEESKVVSYSDEQEDVEETKKICVPCSQEKEGSQEKWQEQECIEELNQEEEEQEEQEEHEQQQQLRSSPLPQPLTFIHTNNQDHVNEFNMREEYPNYIASLPFFNSIAIDSHNEQLESQLLQYRTRMMETPSVPIANTSHSVSLESIRKCLIVFRRLCKEYSELCERNERRINEMNKQYELHNKAIVLSYEHNVDSCYNNLHDDNMLTTHKTTNINANNDIVTELICRTEEQEKLLTERYQCKLQEKEALEEKIRAIHAEQTKEKLELEMYENTLRPEKLQQFTERHDKICELIEKIAQEKEKLIHLSANVQEKMEEITSNELYPHPHPPSSSHSNHSHHSHHVFHHPRNQPELITAPSSATELESSTTLSSKSSSMILTTKNLETTSSLPTFPTTHHSTEKVNTCVTSEPKSERNDGINKNMPKLTAVSKAIARVNIEKRRKTENNEVCSSHEHSFHQTSVVNCKNSSWTSSITPSYEHVLDNVKYTLPRFLKQKPRFCSESMSSRILEDEQETERDLFAVYYLHKPKKPSIRPYLDYITDNKTNSRDTHLHLHKRQVKPQEVNHPYYRRHKRFHLPFGARPFHDKT